MKKTSILFIILASFCLLLSACGSKAEVEIETEPIEFSISESQLHGICKLATLKCYFNNVAKTSMKGNLLQRGSKLWIEYSGTVNMGVDVSKVTLEVDGDQLIITMPDAEVLSVDDPVLDKDSYYLSDQGLFSAKINAEDERDALTEAQKSMMQLANDSDLLQTAKMRAQKLIENYVKQMDELAGTAHTIVWKSAS